MSLIATRDAIVSEIQSSVPELQSVQGHDGNFDLEEIRRHFSRGTAARVVSLGVADIEDHGFEPVATARWGMFIAAQSRTGADPNGAASPGDVAVALVTRVLEVMRAQTWNGNAFRVPENVNAQNLYSGNLSKRGVTLWVIRWDQQVVLDGENAANLEVLRTVRTDYELSDVVSGPEEAIETSLDTRLLATRTGDIIVARDGRQIKLRGVAA